MHPLDDVLIHALTALFAVGAAGCLLVIPIVGYKFVAVLFERDPHERADTPGGAPPEPAA